MKKITAALAALTLALGGVVMMATMASATTEVCVPSDGVAAYDETIVDAEAYDETVIDSAAHWQRYSYQGSWESNDAPTFPGDQWQPNVQGDPHGIGVAGPYSVSHGNSGNVDWFYLEWVPEASHVVHHDEVSHIEHHDAIPPVVCDPVEDPHHEIALYCYDKINGDLPASWENSGYQTLVATKLGDVDWTLAEKRVLCDSPEVVCEPGNHASQTDWGNVLEAFVWPEHITYPTDPVGWPPLYNAVHTDLTQTQESEEICDPVIVVHDPIVEHKTVTIVNCDGSASDESFSRTQTWDAEADAYGEFSEWVSDGAATSRDATPEELAGLEDCPTPTPTEPPALGDTLAYTGSDGVPLFLGGAAALLLLGAAAIFANRARRI